MIEISRAREGSSPCPGFGQEKLPSCAQLERSWVDKAVKSLQEFTDALSGESYVSVSNIKPVLHLFQTSLLQPEEEDTELTKTIKGNIMQYLDEKYSDPVKDEILDKC